VSFVDLASYDDDNGDDALEEDDDKHKHLHEYTNTHTYTPRDTYLE
jgi:hypothetical protein